MKRQINLRTMEIMILHSVTIRTGVIQTAAISPSIMTAIERDITVSEATADTYTKQRRSAQSSTRLFARRVGTNRESNGVASTPLTLAASERVVADPYSG